MQDAVKQRIKCALSKYNETINSFSKKINAVQSTINSQINGKATLSVNTLCELCYLFPTVSAEWLLRGDGDMLREEGEKNFNIEGTVNADQERLKRKLEHAHKQIETLERAIEDKTEIISLLKDKTALQSEIIASKSRDIKELTEQCAQLLNELTKGK